MRWSVSRRKSPRRHEPHAIENARHTIVGLWLRTAMLLPLHPGKALWEAHRVTQGCPQGSMQPMVMDQRRSFKSHADPRICWRPHCASISRGCREGRVVLTWHMMMPTSKTRNQFNENAAGYRQRASSWLCALRTSHWSSEEAYHKI